LVGLNQLFGGLTWAWVDEMDPRTTLPHGSQLSHGCVMFRVSWKRRSF